MPESLPKGCRLFALESHGDERGSLIAIESHREFPFDVARVYYIFGTQPNVTRGYHAHRHLNQLAVAVSGRCTIILDDGKTRHSVQLDDPTVGLRIGSLIWREMSDFSPDCVLLVLADAPYNESDYIRDYDAFCAEVAA